ncbi:Oidioi.mRNA.OKI2018_I69.chr2.g5410.t1.cds [Oikopleura dioica]|uniref:Oidioi.mRNA.OKI2018_I69.chr2.g5410.t1.cds n=1 Tax=Oikopleura dioica TaxID=34765 RepID=A0ABN7T6U4_OIKDI|nr:Oidioi.mRNA.OKI2018_I69.chr2.g5410.t1.cds [Oikopleura dioica]
MVKFSIFYSLLILRESDAAGQEKNILPGALKSVWSPTACSSDNACNSLVDREITPESYIESSRGNEHTVTIKLNDKFVISRVFVYPRTLRPNHNVGETEVLVGNNNDQKRCGNVMKRVATLILP